MLDSKDFFSKSKFKLKNGNSSLASFNGRSITFRLFQSKNFISLKQKPLILINTSYQRQSKPKTQKPETQNKTSLITPNLPCPKQKLFLGKGSVASKLF